MSHQSRNIVSVVESVKELIAQKLYTLAANALQKGLSNNPTAIELLRLEAKLATESRDFYRAATLYENLLKKYPDDPVLTLDNARAWSRLGEFDLALQYSKRSVELSNGSVPSALSLADLYERTNKADKADAILCSLADVCQENGNYQRLVARIFISKNEYGKAVDYIRELLEKEQTDRRVTKLCFLLSKAYDRLGEYDKAWEAASEAHGHDDSPFDENAFLAQFSDMRSFMNKDLIAALTRGPETEVEPLFIVANPRSGTSLLEQIVSMHTEIANAGEMPTGSLLQADVATLTDSFHPWPMNLVDLTEVHASVLSERYIEHCSFFSNSDTVISNKALNLHVHLGFLSRILPSSRAILLERNPLDNAVSCFMNNLLAAGLPYTNSIACIGKVWVERKKMSALWMDALQIPVMELHYEDLVANQREETERIIQFLGLPWQEDCMEFHRSKRVARTISYDQVNQKMYCTSSGRWKNYEKYLGPLMDVVSDYM